MESEINISATGSYFKEMPQDLQDGLAEEVKKHMESYGCKNVEVRVSISDSLKTVLFKVK